MKPSPEYDSLLTGDLDTDEEAAVAQKDKLKAYKPYEKSLLPVGSSNSTTSLPYYIKYGREYQVVLHYKSFHYVQEIFRKASNHIAQVHNYYNGSLL